MPFMKHHSEALEGDEFCLHGRFLQKYEHRSKYKIREPFKKCFEINLLNQIHKVKII